MTNTSVDSAAENNQLAAESTPLERGAYPDRQEIAELAYALWQARGCPDGSGEEDWLRAEWELTSQPSNSPSLSAVGATA